MKKVFSVETIGKRVVGMSTSPWFDHLPVLGNLPQEEAIAKLRDVGEDEAADLLASAQSESSHVFGVGERLRDAFKLKPFQHTGQILGYISPTQFSNTVQDIEDVSSIPSSKESAVSLKHTRIKVALAALRVAAYPGRGIHQILIHFFAQNQLPDKLKKAANQSEDVHFNATYRVRQGENASVRGYPIFVGLNVGDEGLLFKCRTINVKNEQDEGFLSFLRSDVFRSGLHLISTIQPAIAPLSAMSYGLAEAIAAHHRNFSVQDIILGLDFGDSPTGVRLAEGAYIAVQTPPVAWKWDAWTYNATSNLIIRKDNQQPIPYNYIIFTISRYESI